MRNAFLESAAVRKFTTNLKTFTIILITSSLKDDKAKGTMG